MNGEIPDNVVEEIGLSESQKARYTKFLSSFLSRVKTETAGMHFGSFEYGEIVAFELIKHLKWFEREVREEERGRTVHKHDVDVV